MQIITQFDFIPEAAKESVIALGNFDGVHLGHQKLIHRMNQIAAKLGKPSAVLTFDPHPATILRTHQPHKYLGTQEQKNRWLETLEIDYLFLVPFNPLFSQITATDFVRTFLAHQLAASHLVIGHDFIFGHNRTGNALLLQQLAATYHYELTQIDAVAINQIICSSTSIRHAIKEGQLEKAQSLLGRPYQMAGIVEEGRQMGRTIGFPTANLRLGNYAIPPFGVYAVSVNIDGHLLEGVANLGIRPSFVKDDTPLLEIHLFHFDQIIYNHYIEVSLLHFIRPEQVFASTELLSAQIKQDCTIAHSFFRKQDLSK